MKIDAHPPAVNWLMTGFVRAGARRRAGAAGLAPWLVISRGIAGWTGASSPPSRAGGRDGRRGGERHRGDLVHRRDRLPDRRPARGGRGGVSRRVRDTRLGDAIRFTAEVLSGVTLHRGRHRRLRVGGPAMRRFSALAGGVALAVLMVPTLARSTEELVRLVPGALREPRWRWACRSGALRCASSCGRRWADHDRDPPVGRRAAGETAPLLFTSLNNSSGTGGPIAHGLAHRADLQLRSEPV